jgi:hypothetical protein
MVENVGRCLLDQNTIKCQSRLSRNDPRAFRRQADHIRESGDRAMGLELVVVTRAARTGERQRRSVCMLNEAARPSCSQRGPHRVLTCFTSFAT